MKAHEISEATNCPTAHQADKRVNVHCGTERVFFITISRMDRKDIPDGTAGYFPSTRRLNTTRFVRACHLHSSYVQTVNGKAVKSSLQYAHTVRGHMLHSLSTCTEPKASHK